MSDDYTGWMRLTSNDPPQVEIELCDRMGSRIVVRGFRDPRPGKAWTLVGRVVLAEHLRIEGLDGEDNIVNA